MKLDTEFMSVKNIYNEFLVENKINLSPEYQRQFTWNGEQINLFLDSLINCFIIPSIVLLEKEDEENGYEYECVDGQHRLNVIKGFIENKIVYKVRRENGRTFNNYYYKEGQVFCDEKTCLQLIDKKSRKSFDSAKIPVFIIKENNNEQLIRDIFVRLQNGSKVTVLGKLKNKNHPLLDFIRENSILNNFKIKKFSKIINYEFRISEEEIKREENLNKICEKKQKKILFMLARLSYLYKNREIDNFTVDSLNININIEKYLTNNSPNMMMSKTTIENFYDLFENFLSFLNYDGQIIYEEYMILILWKYYLKHGQNNTYKFSQKNIINKYNNLEELKEIKPDNKKCDIIYQNFSNHEIDLLQ